MKKLGARETLKRAGSPLLLAFGLFAAYSAMLAVPGGTLLLVLLEVALSPVAAGVLALLASVFLVRWFWRRHPVSGVSMLSALIALVILAAVPGPADSASRWAANLIDVVAYSGALDDQVRQMRDEGVSPTIAVLAIDGFGSMTSGIAYDPTGEILRPPEQRSKSWWAVGGQTELALDGLEARPIVGHYYAWFHF